MANRPALDPEVASIIDRLSRYSKRLRASTYRTIQLVEIFQSYNDPANPLRAPDLARHRASGAVNHLIDAAIRELVLIVVRVFDRPRQGQDVLRSDKVSFPVVLQLAAIAGVREYLREDARCWFEDGFQADRNEAAVERSIEELSVALDRLANEVPNRSRLLRDFRDEFLAHELEFSTDRARPVYKHLTDMVLELEGLTKATSMAFEGSQVEFEIGHRDARHGADALWELLAKGVGRG